MILMRVDHSLVVIKKLLKRVGITIEKLVAEESG